MTLEYGILCIVFRPRPLRRIKLPAQGAETPRMCCKPPSPRSSVDIGAPDTADRESASGAPSGGWDIVSAGGRAHLASESALSSTTRSSIKCYLPNTAFRGTDGRLMLAQDLAVGSQVLLSDGDEARVVAYHRHHRQEVKVALVELVTRKAKIKVSAKHRIVVESTPVKTKLAKDLHRGEFIVVGAHPQELTKVTYSEERGDVINISFMPDRPIEAFLVPHHGVQTLGSPFPPGQLYGITEADLLRVAPAFYEE